MSDNKEINFDNIVKEMNKLGYREAFPQQLEKGIRLGFTQNKFYEFTIQELIEKYG
jgi:hypothetical protein